MSEKNFAINEPITILYQAPNKESSATIEATIRLPDGSEDLVNFPVITLVERGNSGTYVGQFTPDDEGEWQVIIAKDNGTGQVTKRYSVGEFNVDKVGKEAKNVKTVVDGIDTQLDTVETKIDNLGTSFTSPPMVS